METNVEHERGGRTLRSVQSELLSDTCLSPACDLQTFIINWLTVSFASYMGEGDLHGKTGGGG